MGDFRLALLFSVTAFFFVNTSSLGGESNKKKDIVNEKLADVAASSSDKKEAHTFCDKFDDFRWNPSSCSEEAYYLGDEAHDIPILDGKVYVLATKKCYHIKRSIEDKRKKTQELHEISCDPTIVRLATDPYIKTDTIEDYYKELKKCVDKKDVYCIRQLVYRNVTLEHNLYLGENRDYFLLFDKDRTLKLFERIVREWNQSYDLSEKAAIPKIGDCGYLPCIGPTGGSDGQILLHSYATEY